MATLQRVFDGSVQTTSVNSTSVTTGSSTGNIDISAYEGAHVIVDADFPTTPTDDLLVEFYGSLDGGSNDDDTPYAVARISKDTDPNQMSFIVKDLYSFKIIVKRDGSTDTITVTVSYKRFRWETV